MSEVKYAIAILKEKLANADRHNLAYQRLSIADMEAIWGTLEKSDKDCAALKAERDALAAETNWWKPERCPVTNRPFFLWIEHPSGGMVPTYGGPYDSYTVPTVDSDGEFCCERYDHDEGAWVDSECLSVRLTDDREPAVDDAFLNSVRAEGVDKAIAHLHKKFEGTGHIGVPVMALESLANQLRAGEPS